jgi:hypothetical protein
VELLPGGSVQGGCLPVLAVQALGVLVHLVVVPAAGPPVGRRVMGGATRVARVAGGHGAAEHVLRVLQAHSLAARAEMSIHST